VNKDGDVMRTMAMMADAAAKEGNEELTLKEGKRIFYLKDPTLFKYTQTVLVESWRLTYPGCKRTLY